MTEPDLDELHALGVAVRGTLSQPVMVLETNPGNYPSLEGRDGSELADLLLDVNVESCAGCDWWFESCELDDEGECDDCAEHRDE